MKISVPCLDGQSREFNFTKPGPFSETHPALGKAFYFSGCVLIRTDMRRAPTNNVYGLTGSFAKYGATTFYPDPRPEYWEEE